MTIAKAPPRLSSRAAAENAFVNVAPDAKRPRWQRGSKTQVTLSIAPELLAEVDAVAEQKHISRAALIAIWMTDRLEAMKRDKN